MEKKKLKLSYNLWTYRRKNHVGQWKNGEEGKTRAQHGHMNYSEAGKFALSMLAYVALALSLLITNPKQKWTKINFLIMISFI